MKNFVVVMAVLLLFSSCDKETGSEGDSFPVLYRIYFELLDNEGKSINNKQIEITNKLEMKNGSLEPPRNFDILWFKTGVIDSIDITGVQLYGISDEIGKSDFFFPIIFESSERHDRFLKGNSNQTMNWYYLFRNVENPAKIDTLRIYDFIDIQPYQREFKFYLNETLLTLHGDGKFRDDAPNYIQIQVK